MSKPDRNFYTVDPNVVMDCCEGMREQREVAINIDTARGREVVRGIPSRIRRLTDNRFEIWIAE